jgi:hypothetical protein
MGSCVCSVHMCRSAWGSPRALRASSAPHTRGPHRSGVQTPWGRGGGSSCRGCSSALNSSTRGTTRGARGVTGSVAGWHSSGLTHSCSQGSQFGRGGSGGGSSSSSSVASFGIAQPAACYVSLLNPGLQADTGFCICVSGTPGDEGCIDRFLKGQGYIQSMAGKKVIANIGSCCNSCLATLAGGGE